MGLEKRKMMADAMDNFMVDQLFDVKLFVVNALHM